MQKIPYIYTDQIILGHDVEVAMKEMGGAGWRNGLRQLEVTEPALAAFLTTAAGVVGFQLQHDLGGGSKTAVQEAENYLLYALMVVHRVTQTAHRRLNEVPGGDGAVRRSIYLADEEDRRG